MLLAAPGQLAMNTATELAQSAGVSKATATRFFRHIGYESYDAARRQAREMQNSGSPLYLQAAPMSDLFQQRDIQRIPARHGKAVHLDKGEAVQVVALPGSQVVDCWAVLNRTATATAIWPRLISL